MCDPRAEEVRADDGVGHPQDEEEADVGPGQHGRIPRDAAQQKLGEFHYSGAVSTTKTSQPE